jgi:hypothetical protein
MLKKEKEKKKKKKELTSEFKAFYLSRLGKTNSA